MEGDDLPGIRCGERELLLPLPWVHEAVHEERLAGEQPLPRPHEGVQEAAGLAGAVSEDGLHPDAVVHVHEAPRLGERGLARIELDLDVLHGVTEELVVHLVHLGHGRDLLWGARFRARDGEWYAGSGAMVAHALRYPKAYPSGGSHPCRRGSPVRSSSSPGPAR